MGWGKVEVVYVASDEETPDELCIRQIVARWLDAKPDLWSVHGGAAHWTEAEILALGFMDVLGYPICPCGNCMAVRRTLFEAQAPSSRNDSRMNETWEKLRQNYLERAQKSLSKSQKS